MGIPHRIVVSGKTLEKSAVEITDRATGESKLISLDEVKTLLTK
jgi:hypothetical protein